jgi:hypothetical protein
MGRTSGLKWIGAVVAVGLLWATCAAAAEPRVLFLRGWFGVFSTGLDGIADDLKAKGVKAEVAGHLYWQTGLTDILKARAAGKAGPIILIGHSQGANNVIDIARGLEAQNIPVDLVITLAPFMQYPVPANVKQAVNYYQQGGWGAPIEGAPGFHGKIMNVNVNDDPSVTHVNIDKSTRVHADIVRMITSLVKPHEASSGAPATNGIAYSQAPER